MNKKHGMRIAMKMRISFLCEATAHHALDWAASTVQEAQCYGPAKPPTPFAPTAETRQGSEVQSVPAARMLAE